MFPNKGFSDRVVVRRGVAIEIGVLVCRREWSTLQPLWRNIGVN